MKKKLIILITIAFVGLNLQAQTLAERLGYKKTDKLLIINNDDVGMCHAANTATIEGMENGLISSATIMTPCPWYNEIARYAAANPEKDFGVHLTLTSEWKNYRWGTVAPQNEVPGLYDEQGYMWKGVREVYASSNTEEALIEGRAQIKKALTSGIPITHIDSHMGTYQYLPDYMNIYIQLADEFNLPARMPSQSTIDNMNFPNVRKLCDEKGIIYPDYFIFEEFENYKTENVFEFWTEYIKNLKPGVTEIYVHAASEGDEIRAITGSAEKRIKELEFFTSDTLKKLIEDEGVIVIGYRPLLELQRKNRK
ncbi:MAG: polysaccharide deacetylase family protein [Dysgonamonadaceae bacterium]|nr:polysaccharide deacetylase family protein [Dysgonamonadaceae bacterium]MDD3727437.1 polysaccharide deacetylase family protein [Dysgonamonadaceae bacterium]MDD4247166.1 polysaccharide deacetylase family protein [Dysgonamonadaceae bacterium]MDD4604961.1 polysaccharide deacetylase family protein [Dysgonamonadaceae bacterium]HUI32980.1 polysaccharide deacetylase family protein [Dysgonamonadaceae bacterium]